MSKRKPVKASKQARSKVAPKALRARQAVVRSAKPSASRSRPKQQSDSTVDAAVHEAPAAALPIVESPAIASQNESQLVAKTVESAKAMTCSRQLQTFGLFRNETATNSTSEYETRF